MHWSRRVGDPFITAGSCTTEAAGRGGRAIEYYERLAEAGVKPSVGSVSNTYDNALAETINGLY